MATKAKFIFFGSAPLSLSFLNELKEFGILPSKIVTLAPAPFGRGRKLKANPAESFAVENNIPFIHWQNSKTTIDAIGSENYDFALVFAFGKILKKDLLETPNIKCGFINLHPSLLPKLRGPSPIRSSLLLNQKEAVGITYIKMDDKMDHGPILLQEKYEPSVWPLPGSELDLQLIKQAARLFVNHLDELTNCKVEAKEQKHNDASYTKFFTKDVCQINYQSINEHGYLQGKDQFIACACDQNPGPYFFAQKNGKNIRIKISKLNAPENGKVQILKVIPEGKKEMSWESFTQFIEN